MSDQLIHINDDGSTYNPPAVTQQSPSILHLDDNGNVIGQNGQLRTDLLKSVPKGNVDIGENMPSGQQIGTAVAKGLPAIGATAMQAAFPEVPGGAGVAGAAGGTAVANILKSYAPKYFSESGQAPSMEKQLTDIGVNGGLEGTGQLIAKAIPEATRLTLAAAGKVPPFRSAVARAANEEDTQNLLDKSNEDTDQARALKNVIKKGMKGGRITNTDAIREELDNPDTTKAWKTDFQGRKSYQDLIDPATRDNIKKIMDQTDKLKENNKGEEGLINWKNGKYLMKYGAGMVVDKALGIGHPYFTGAAVTGGIELGQKALQKIASDPNLTGAMVKAMDSSTPPAMQTLLRQGLLQGLRGTEVEYQLPDGKNETVTIGPDGKPQLPRQ